MANAVYSDVQVLTFQDRYSHDGEQFPHQAWRRVSNAVAEAEAAPSREEWAQRFYSLMENSRYVPGGRILAALGTGAGVTAQNCYVIPSPEDSRQAIVGTSLMQWTEIQSKGGGVGINISSLRPSGDLVKGVNGTSSGPVTWAQLFAYVSHDVVIQGGSRRGAAMIMIDCDHPDVFEFIHAKEVPGRLEGCNMSVCISDAFMEAVKRNDDWDLKWGGRVYRTVKAKQVWDEIVEAAWASAEPGIYFMERANKEANSGYFESLISTNPCIIRGSLISSPEGLRPVEEISEGDLIGTVRGPRPVTSVEKHASVPVFRVRLSDGAEVVATAAHRFHAIKKKDRAVNNATKKFSKIRLDELQAGDQLRIAPMEMPEGQVPDLPPSLDEREYGLLLGLLLGDGTMTPASLARNRVFLATDGASDGWNSSLRRLLEKATDVPVGYYADATRPRSANFRSQGENGLSAIVKASEIEPGYSHTKRIPAVYFRTNERFLSGLVDGLFSADGNVNLSSNHPDLRFTTVSKGLAQDLRRVLLMFGIHGRVTSGRPSGGTIDSRDIKSDKTKYVLHVSGAGIRTFGERIGISEPSKAEKLREALNDWGLTGNTWMASVVEIEPAGEGEVYDLYEEQTDTWICEGVVSQGCGEQPLGPYGACLLGSFNLRAFVKQDPQGTEKIFDFEEFKQYVPLAVRFNDNIVDLSHYPLEECADSQRRIRRMGIGVMGLADVLLDLKIRYGSKEAISLTSSIMKTLRDESYRASVALSAERGAFPEFVAEEYLKRPFIKRLPADVRRGIQEYGIRNCYLLSVAPTGTISQMTGVNSGIEPYFDFEYFRKDRLGEYWVKSDWSDLYAKKDGRPDYVVAAMDVTPEEHVLMQAACQEFVDSSISKTANMPNSATVDDVARLYMLAYDEGLKSLSVYRDGSRAVQVLNTAASMAPEAPPQNVVSFNGRRRLPTDRAAINHKFEVDGVEGYLTVGLFEDGQPGEVFINISKQGSTMNGLFDVVGMLLSYCFQYGVPFEALSDKLTGQLFAPAGRTANKDIPFATSIIDYVVRYISHRWMGAGALVGGATEAVGSITGEACPMCGQMMRQADGCQHCPSCSFEKCG